MGHVPEPPHTVTLHVRCYTAQRCATRTKLPAPGPRSTTSVILSIATQALQHSSTVVLTFGSCLHSLADRFHLVHANRLHSNIH